MLTLKRASERANSYRHSVGLVGNQPESGQVEWSQLESLASRLDDDDFVLATRRQL